ncbi:MAG: BlaI/MecI/CopY family transcriptional regulator [bacterium]|nr:BlaI/MecI/CopY family transcriptional regulator [bacterium]
MSHEDTETPRRTLSELEREVMQVIWPSEGSTAEEVRLRLETEGRALKDSTVRTVLRRLEEKGFVDHETAGRTYVYRPLVRPRAAAAQAVRQIVDRFCGGSVEELLLGLVDDSVVSRDQLRRLEELIDRDEREGENS